MVLPSAEGNEGSRQRRRRIVAGSIAAAVVLLLVVILVLVNGRGGGRRTVAAGPTTIASTGPTTTAGPATTASAPATTAPAGPASTAAPTPPTSAPQGVALSANGAFLHKAPPPTVQSTAPPTANCTDLGDAGWTVECARVVTAGGTRVWLVEHKAATPTTLWRAFVLEWSQGRGLWLVDLGFTNGATGVTAMPGTDLTAITVKSPDLTGDGKPELVFGYRSAGTGGYLSYDIVTDGSESGPVVSASRQGLAKGQVRLVDYGLDEYVAAFPGGAPQCCPAYFERSTVRFAAPSFELVPAGQVAAPGPGQLDL